MTLLAAKYRSHALKMLPTTRLEHTCRRSSAGGFATKHPPLAQRMHRLMHSALVAMAPSAPSILTLMLSLPICSKACGRVVQLAPMLLYSPPAIRGKVRPKEQYSGTSQQAVRTRVILILKRPGRALSQPGLL